MTSFKKTSELGELGQRDIVKFLREHKRLTVTVNPGGIEDNNPIRRDQQRRQGDLYIQGWKERGSPLWMETKTEEENRSGNFFLETWSNKTFGRQTTGWMIHMNCDLLVYYFFNDRQAFLLDFAQLWNWSWDLLPTRRERLRSEFVEVVQSKNEQLNKTAGCLVPIGVLRQFPQIMLEEWDLACVNPKPAKPPKTYEEIRPVNSKPRESTLFDWQ